MTSALTDVTSDVEDVFEELECIFDGAGEHSGGTVAYMECHDCCAGFMCQGHLQYYVDVYRAKVNRFFSQFGYVKCRQCRVQFPSVSEHHRVFSA